ncbi:MAG: hypothetical protein WA814_00175 [Candidatus Baltobacteraceae bacterium]
MRISRPATYAVGVVTAAALLAGCTGTGGSQTALAPGSGTNSFAAAHAGGVGPLNRTTSITSVKSRPVHRDHHKSWVSPDVARLPRLLFLSDSGTDDVYIYTMPAMALKGTLTGFSEPQGMCSAPDGSIWVTNTGTQQTLWYSRAGTPIGSLSDPSGYPVGCAVNPTNGDVAVTNIFDVSGNGGVEIYPGGSGSPTFYTNPAQSEYFFPAYDRSGNLYVDGFGNSGFALSELPAGSSTMSTVGVSGGTIYFPGGVNWNRTAGDLTIGDQECNGGADSCVYTLSVSGSTATITGSTPLQNFDGTACDVDQGTIAPFGRYFAGGCITEGSSFSSADRWAFPTGGTPTNYNISGLSEPIGAAISNK